MTSGRHGHGDSPCPLIATASGNRIETCVDGGVGAETLIASENKIGDGAVSRNPNVSGESKGTEGKRQEQERSREVPFLLPPTRLRIRQSPSFYESDKMNDGGQKQWEVSKYTRSAIPSQP